jgi:hypothetical protein
VLGQTFYVVHYANQTLAYQKNYRNNCYRNYFKHLTVFDIVFTNLEAKRLNTDIALNSLGDWLTLTSPNHFRSRDVFRVHLQAYRDGLDPLNTTVQAAIKFYSNNNEIIIDWVGLTVRDSQSESTWQLLTAYHMLLLSKEQAGTERAIGTTFFAGGLHV